MKEQGKIIKIDPTLFTFSNNKNKTKKKENNDKNNTGIRIKTKQKQKRDTLKKQSLLKMIRNHQEDKYKQLFEKKNKPEPIQETNKNKFNASFDDSKDYLANLMSEQEKTLQPVAKNKTLKDRTNLLNNSNALTNMDSSIKLDLTNLNNNNTTSAQMPIISLEPNVELVSEKKQSEPILNDIDLQKKPDYGCLKGGTLPTYRNYFNKTKKNINNIFGSGPTPINTREIIEKNNKKQSNYGEIHRKNKQKRIMRRSYKTGKSLKVPKISVLISNKTIRNNTNLKIMKIKELPISKVKKELIRRGLIKIGTITPNDVLRKMYETIELLCGDVQNYNTDNLLYNFINDK